MTKHKEKVGSMNGSATNWSEVFFIEEARYVIDP